MVINHVIIVSLMQASIAITANKLQSPCPVTVLKETDVLSGSCKVIISYLNHDFILYFLGSFLKSQEVRKPTVTVKYSYFLNVGKLKIEDYRYIR